MVNTVIFIIMLAKVINLRYTMYYKIIISGFI
jgi:hypothetical protein